MRIVIKSQGLLMIIPDWFCKQENIICKTAEKIKETDKAILLDISGTEKWVPRSLITTQKIPIGLGAWVENE